MQRISLDVSGGLAGRSSSLKLDYELLDYRLGECVWTGTLTRDAPNGRNGHADVAEADINHLANLAHRVRRALIVAETTTGQRLVTPGAQGYDLPVTTLRVPMAGGTFEVEHAPGDRVVADITQLETALTGLAERLLDGVATPGE